MNGISKEEIDPKLEATISSLKTTMIVTALSTVVATVLGVGALNAMLFANMLASLESDDDMKVIQAELKRQAEETAVLLKQLETRENAHLPNRSDAPHAAN